MFSFGFMAFVAPNAYSPRSRLLSHRPSPPLHDDRLLTILQNPGPHSGLHTPIALPSFSPKVSFDTFENPAASMFSFTLSVKSEG